MVDQTTADGDDPETEDTSDIGEQPAGLDRGTAARLAWIRYLFGIAEQQCAFPEELRSIAILSMHDAVELFLHLAAQHANVPLSKARKVEFGEYFSEITKANPALKLSRQQQMKQLNTARVGLKHDGVRPIGRDVEEFRVQVSRFLIENTILVFRVSLEDVSVIDLIRFPMTRDALRGAESAMARGEFFRAMIGIVSGFDSLIGEYEREAKAVHGRSPFAFANNFQFDRSVFRRAPFHHDPFGPRDQGDFEDKIIESIEGMGSALRMLSLGLDYRRYAQFRMLSPPRHLLKIDPKIRTSPAEKLPTSEADCRFCLDFVVDSALQLQEIVFTEPSWRRRPET
jgi:hypothetical protein